MASRKSILLAKTAFLSLLAMPALAESPISSFFNFSGEAKKDGAPAKKTPAAKAPAAAVAVEPEASMAIEVKKDSAVKGALEKAKTETGKAVTKSKDAGKADVVKPEETAITIETETKSEVGNPAEAKEEIKIGVKSDVKTETKTETKEEPKKAEEPKVETPKAVIVEEPIDEAKEQPKDAKKEELKRPIETNPPPPEDASVDYSKTLFGVAKANGAGMFVQLFTDAGLGLRLKGPGHQTVFAPSDAAFAKLGGKFLEDLKKKDNSDQLNAILTYHIVNGSLTTKELRGAINEPNASQGAILRIDGTGSDILVGSGKVTKSDISATNGTLHIIDTVQIPPTP
jgi:uncharacterized surface protein with fasciclin (FAS1) repeats